MGGSRARVNARVTSVSMDPAKVRVLCWNVRRAGQRSGVWPLLAELDPDVALLQEVTAVPRQVEDTYSVLTAHPSGRSGSPQSFKTVILAKSGLSIGPVLECAAPWANEEMIRLAGNFLSAATLLKGQRLNLVSAYSPAWPIDEARLEGVDLGNVRLPGNPSVWATELLWLSLTNTLMKTDDLG